MSRFLVHFFAYLFLTQAAQALPARVMIIRHAEKTSDSNNPHLSPVGFQRAEALKKLFEIHPEYAVPNLPNELFAAAYIPSESSMRSIETLTPLARSLQLTPNDQYSSEKTVELGEELLTNPAFDHHVILIAWKHSEISNLAHALEAPCKLKWNSNVFDRVWLIDYANDGRVTCKDVPESVLVGDSSYQQPLRY